MQETLPSDAEMNQEFASMGLESVIDPQLVEQTLAQNDGALQPLPFGAWLPADVLPVSPRQEDNWVETPIYGTGDRSNVQIGSKRDPA